MADSQLAATRDAGAQIALMNPGGIRGELVPDANGTLTFGQIYTVQPFGNTLITKSFTGAQLLALLRSQFHEDGNTIFSVSEGFREVLARDGEGYRFVSASLNGQPIDPDATYRVTMNSFLSTGGDGFTIFAEGTDAVTGPVDLDATEAYLDDEAGRILPPTGRIVVVE